MDAYSPDAVTRIRREIEGLQLEMARGEQAQASKTEGIIVLRSRLSEGLRPHEVDRLNRRICDLEKEVLCLRQRNASIATTVAQKTAAFHKVVVEPYREAARETMRLKARLKHRKKADRRREKVLLQDLQAALENPTQPQPVTKPMLTQYDAFISHASDDKDGVVRPLAQQLTSIGHRIWYDEFQLKVGDSLRRSIDRGLAASRFGVVILSPSFFAKNWPQYELDGLLAKELAGGKVILPIWHRVSKDDVLSYSPILADRIALTTATLTIAELAEALGDVLGAAEQTGCSEARDRASVSGPASSARGR